MKTRIAEWMLLSAVSLTLAAFGLSAAQNANAKLDKPIPRGAKVFIAPVEGGFETYLAAGIQKKQVPVVVVAHPEMAEYEISGVAESEKAGWAKMLFLGSSASKEQAGIKITNIKTQEIVFAYAVHKSNSARGKQSAAEACAKHLKEKIEQAK